MLPFLTLYGAWHSVGQWASFDYSRHCLRRGQGLEKVPILLATGGSSGVVMMVILLQINQAFWSYGALKSVPTPRKS